MQSSDETPGHSLLGMFYLGFGIILTLTGLTLALLTFSMAYNAVYHPDDIPLLKRVLAMADANEPLLTQETVEGKTVWTGSIVRFASYFGITAVLVLAMISIVIGLVRVGGENLGRAWAEQKLINTDQLIVRRVEQMLAARGMRNPNAPTDTSNPPPRPRP